MSWIRPCFFGSLEKEASGILTGCRSSAVLIFAVERYHNTLFLVTWDTISTGSGMAFLGMLFCPVSDLGDTAVSNRSSSSYSLTNS